MLRSAWLAVGAGLAAALTAGCAPGGTVAGGAESALVTVGGAAVTGDEVRALLSPDGEMPVRFAVGADGFVGGADPLHDALRAAVADELLAQEAERRGIEGRNRAEQISHLIDLEIRRDAGDEFDEAQVRGWYDDHRYLFGDVGAADVNYVVLGSPAHLDDVVAGLQRPDPDPEALAARYAGVGGGRIAMAHGSDEVPLMVERIVHAARHPGTIAYDHDTGAGEWWVVQIQDITLEAPPWSPELAAKVEAAMTWAIEQDRITAWALSLEERWPVVVHEENVEQFDRSLRGN